MAQTKRKRKTKHRGNAAGVVESRGRTGRKPTGAETGKGGGPKVRVDRREKPPTWSSAANRAAIAAGIFAIALVVIFNRPISAAIALAAAMMVIYVPMTYFTDRWAHNRFVAKNGGPATVKKRR